MILVTGATGHVGGSIVRRLAASGIRCRALVRDAVRGAAFLEHLSVSGAAAPALSHHTVATDAGTAEVELAVGDFGDDVALTRAMHGVSAVFLVCLPEPAPARLVKHAAVIRTAVAVGVPHVVYLSFLDPASDARFPQARWHYDTEERLRASGLAWTALRASLYMQSVPTAAGILVGDEWLAPAGDGRVAFVDRYDIAAVAARVLTEAGATGPHAGRAYDVTGPELLSWTDVATRMSGALGRSVRYRNVPPRVLAEHLQAAGRPAALVEGMVGLFEVIREGALAHQTDVVAAIGRVQPTTLAHVLESEWRVAADG